MDVRILRSLIYLFGGLIVVFALLMLVNYIGSMAGAPSALPGQEGRDEEAFSAEDMARQAIASAKSGGAGRSSMIPVRSGLSTAAVTSEGAIRLVKDKDFNGVAEKPKGMMEMLDEMSGGSRRRPAPIAMKESDLDKKVRRFGGDPASETRLKVSSMPEMGRGAAMEGVTLFTAPVDYKVFKSSESWWAFAKTHKCRQTAEAQDELKPALSPLSGPDFSREAVVVLVSVSELPNGIFRIVSFKRSGKELLVSYRVEPMAMAAEGPGEHDFYSAAVIPAGAAVKLAQVP